MPRLRARPVSEWPEDLRRTYQFNQAIGDFWVALEEYPILKRFAAWRNYCGLRWTAAYARAVLAEQDARELLALRDQERRRSG